MRQAERASLLVDNYLYKENFPTKRAKSKGGRYRFRIEAGKSHDPQIARFIDVIL